MERGRRGYLLVMMLCLTLGVSFFFLQPTRTLDTSNPNEQIIISPKSLIGATPTKYKLSDSKDQDEKESDKGIGDVERDKSSEIEKEMGDAIVFEPPDPSSIHFFSTTRNPSNISTLCPMWLSSFINHIEMTVLFVENNKSSKIRDYLFGLHPDTGLVYIDGEESLLACNSKDLTRKAQDALNGREILFGGENSFVDAAETFKLCLNRFHQPYPFSPNPSARFANPSTIFAKSAGALQELWKRVGDKSALSGAIQMHCMFLTGWYESEEEGGGNKTTSTTMIDHHSNAFYSLNQQCPKTVLHREGRLIDPTSLLQPCVYHWNGKPDWKCRQIFFDTYLMANAPKPSDYEALLRYPLWVVRQDGSSSSSSSSSSFTKKPLRFGKYCRAYARELMPDLT